MPATQPSSRSKHPTGDLRAALIEASFEILAEAGAAGFSVAKVAKRVSVSSGAPYKHFKNREELLAAVADQAAVDLAALLDTALAEAGPDPVERFAASAAMFVRYAVDRGAALNAVFAADLEREQHDRLGTAGQQLRDRQQQLAREAADVSPTEFPQLFEQYLAIVYGYAALVRGGFFTHRGHAAAEVESRAAEAIRTLLRGWHTVSAT